MATIHRPLLLKLHTPKGSNRKILLLILSVVSVMCSATFVAIHCIKAINSNNHWSLHQICANAQDQSSCMAMVSETTSINATTKMNEMNEVDLLLIFLNKSTSNIQETIEVANHVKHRINSPRGQAALTDCVELLELSVDRITDSMAALKKRRTSSNEDAHAWLSGVLTNHVTCLDGLDGSATKLMEPRLVELMARAANSLAILVAISPYNTNVIQQYYLRKQIQFPSWVTSRDRLLLRPSQAEAAKANVVVAKDGSGNYKTVKEAVASAPDNSKTRYVIYVKKGTYKENVEVGKKKKNLMIVGDGMDLTIITGSLNVVDGSTTFKSATIAVGGDGFIAQDLWIQNTAGPEKHQAVALRVSADQSVINRCRIDAYQDTLYAHTNRQFYRDCYITGTVDFIFGNAAVVLQNCKIAARKPMSKQSNMVTAQGRTDPNQNTGTSIQKCEVVASSDLEPVKGSIRSYLGRPWKEYSRTVVMQSHIGDHIDPAGWSEWSGDFALKTLYYGEYLNRGPGAGTSKRVKWPGYHVITDPEEAKKFTVAELIGGGSWLKSTGVAYTEGL